MILRNGVAPSSAVESPDPTAGINQWAARRWYSATVRGFSFGRAASHFGKYAASVMSPIRGSRQVPRSMSARTVDSQPSASSLVVNVIGARRRSPDSSIV
ncbi:hypothetical protein KGQ20_46070 [Catenulispora sp. NF23]|uniref:Uncharacterized protein n=1 Tax=Catenulispora pinistramenti TaxID=2705254 RepID=A0ABS5KJ28_9ACTN|nr:hypothetical protein [Catenulispora pinistramenti]MBS2546393.1 hypothetical protein [Catenulispora pinistramenti]